MQGLVDRKTTRTGFSPAKHDACSSPGIHAGLYRPEVHPCSDRKSPTPRTGYSPQITIVQRYPTGKPDRSGLYPQPIFHDLLAREIRRIQRSAASLVLILLDIQKAPVRGLFMNRIPSIVSMLTDATRDTDIRGWYERNRVIGIVCTETDCSGKRHIEQKIHSGLHGRLGPQRAQKVLLRTCLLDQDTATQITFR